MLGHHVSVGVDVGFVVRRRHCSSSSLFVVIIIVWGRHCSSSTLFVIVGRWCCCCCFLMLLLFVDVVVIHCCWCFFVVVVVCHLLLLLFIIFCCCCCCSSLFVVVCHCLLLFIIVCWSSLLLLSSLIVVVIVFIVVHSCCCLSPLLLLIDVSWQQQLCGWGQTARDCLAWSNEGNKAVLRKVKKCFGLGILRIYGQPYVKDIFWSISVAWIFPERNVCPAPVENLINWSLTLKSLYAGDKVPYNNFLPTSWIRLQKG